MLKSFSSALQLGTCAPEPSFWSSFYSVHHQKRLLPTERGSQGAQDHVPLHPLLVAAVSKHCLGGHVDNQGHLVLRNSLLVPGTYSNTKNISAPVHGLGIPSSLTLWCYQSCPLRLAEQGFSEHSPGSPRYKAQATFADISTVPHRADPFLHQQHICRASRSPNASAQALHSCYVQSRLHCSPGRHLGTFLLWRSLRENGPVALTEPHRSRLP